MPLELRLRGKSTTQSYRTAIYYVDLVVGSGFKLTEAIAYARKVDGERKAGGFDQAALDVAARLGFGNGAFEESSEDVPAVVEEFYLEDSGGDGAESGIEGDRIDSRNPNLKEKLDRRATRATRGQP